MSSVYLKSSQIVPGKGMSYTYYELGEGDVIQRMLTTIPESGVVKRYPKPPVKKLFAPERCEDSSQAEFLELWERGG
jgi:hypothetical protein